MIASIHAQVFCKGNLVRSQIVRFATVTRYLIQVPTLADYWVMYWVGGAPQRMSAETFLVQHRAGAFDADVNKGEGRCYDWVAQEAVLERELRR
jgi:hypothetical protein